MSTWRCRIFGHKWRAYKIDQRDTDVVFRRYCVRCDKRSDGPSFPYV